VDFVTKFPIERKKSFQILCERKKVSFELYQRKMLISTTQLGKGELRLVPMLEKCEMVENIEVGGTFGDILCRVDQSRTKSYRCAGSAC
jgi:hypothetical protein